MLNKHICFRQLQPPPRPGEAGEIAPTELLPPCSFSWSAVGCACPECLACCPGRSAAFGKLHFPALSEGASPCSRFTGCSPPSPPSPDFSEEIPAAGLLRRECCVVFLASLWAAISSREAGRESRERRGEPGRRHGGRSGAARSAGGTSRPSGPRCVRAQSGARQWCSYGQGDSEALPSEPRMALGVRGMAALRRRSSCCCNT